MGKTIINKDTELLNKFNILIHLRKFSFDIFHMSGFSEARTQVWVGIQ